jgi:hypothetical protein
MKAEQIMAMCPMAALLKTRENFRQTNGMMTTYKPTMATQIVSILIGLFCIHLSWSCSVGEVLPQRIIYAFFAFLFGPFYLAYYFFVRSQHCSK